MFNFLIGMVVNYQEDFGEPIKMEQILNFIDNSDNCPPELFEHHKLVGALLDLEDKGYLMLSENGWSTWVPNRGRE